MKYVKCPRCDTNYMPEGEPYCDVCKAELKIGPQIKFAALDGDDEQDQILCPVCKRNFIDEGEEMCEECREAQSEKIREAEEFEKYRGEWMVPVCGQTEESHPNPVGMTVEEFLEKQTQSQAQSPKTKRLSRDQELAEKFAKKREFMKRKKMYE